MNFRNIFWQLYPPLMAIITFAIIFFYFFLESHRILNGATLTHFILTCLLLVLSLTFFTLLFSHRIRKAVKVITRYAKNQKAGDRVQYIHLPLSAPSELMEMGQTLQDVSHQIQDQYRTILRQKLEMEAMFGSMMEGVLTVNSNGKVLQINNSATRLLQVPTGVNPFDQHVSKIIKSKAMKELIVGHLFFNQPTEKEIILKGKQERLIQIHSNTLRNPNEEKIGTLFVFNDLTRMRQLENHQRNFVGNVSHELKTPLTSIKGFVETLMDGAIENPEDGKHFLKIILKQVHRLHRLIEDLLTLSRVEKEGGQYEIKLIPTTLNEVIFQSCEICRILAEDKNITMVLPENSSEVMARINPPLIEQALVNLLDNAIKYSPNGTKVEIDLKVVQARVVISVKDQGPGISRENINKIYERFFRVDESRNSQTGGSGLGLSIVQSIMNVHHGKVDVSSRLQEGSVFSIILPQYHS